jgi:crossover junction endodeoxyribonuclease RuvC
MILLGLDPGLQSTGWGVIEAQGNRLRHIANGQVRSRADDALGQRLTMLYEALEAIIAEHRPDAAAVEETFFNQNPRSTLKLGQARGVALLAAARSGIVVGEYAPNVIKKAVVGVGHADKDQVHAMVKRLLPGAIAAGPDAADALAIAIAHAHILNTSKVLEKVRL